MTTILWITVAFVVIGAPTWIALCAWYSLRPRTLGDPRIAAAENCIERSSRLGNAEFCAALIDNAAVLYHAIARDCKRPKVAEVYLRMAADCKAKSHAIREHARLLL